MTYGSFPILKLLSAHVGALRTELLGSVSMLVCSIAKMPAIASMSADPGSPRRGGLDLQTGWPCSRRSATKTSITSRSFTDCSSSRRLTFAFSGGRFLPDRWNTSLDAALPRIS
jgi:hypothetical protein